MELVLCTDTRPIITFFQYIGHQGPALLVCKMHGAFFRGERAFELRKRDRPPGKTRHCETQRITKTPIPRQVHGNPLLEPPGERALAFFPKIYMGIFVNKGLMKTFRGVAAQGLEVDEYQVFPCDSAGKNMFAGVPGFLSEFLPGQANDYLRFFIKWSGNLVNQYNALPEDVKTEIQHMCDGTLGRAVRSLVPVLGEDHEVIRNLKACIKGELPKSSDDFEKH